ncbi:MAG: hypothetical protein DKT66_24245 [Candidatus Melainabacteria bacterium]|nr:MAG: hypothetical protein DKT66_24245 [Candidatus Melainabacteria bacterium]
MKNTSLSAEEIVMALQQREAGEPVEQICTRFGISVATFYNMRKRYSGLEVSVLKQVRELEIEKLKLTKEIEVLKQDQAILHEILDVQIASSEQARTCSRSAQLVR